MLTPLAAVTDPSWFYSSMSQAAAGIIGLMGGLLLSRLLQQLTVIRESKAQLVQDFVAVRGAALSARQAVRSYASFLDSQIPNLQQAVAQGQTNQTVWAWQSFQGSSSSSTGQNLVLAQALPKYEHDRVVCDEFVAAIEPVIVLTSLTGLDGQAARLRQLAAAWPEEARQLLEPIAAQLAAMAPSSRSHAENVLPGNAVAMLAILAWLAITSVVLPLHFLVTEVGIGSQLVLLGAFAIGIIGLLLYLWLTLNDLRVAGQLQLPDRDRLPQAMLN